MNTSAVLSKHRGLQREILRRHAQTLRYAITAFEPPYDPWRIAAHLGVPVESKQLTGIDGYVDLNGGEPKIFLASNGSAERKRFTLAHELGHVLLIHAFRDGRQPLTFGLRRYRTREISADFSSDPDEERLCNYFAAELLMPREDVISFMRGHSLRPELILTISRLFRVSLQAAAKRLSDICRANSTMSLWTRHPWPTRRWVVGKMTMDTQKKVAVFLQRPSVDGLFQWQNRSGAMNAEVLPLQKDLALVAVLPDQRAGTRRP